ncbi:MAG TPA: FAD-dependent oxidoreductase [Bryobacteraceae bacterium]|nr:FAD-dependent oxidoreductase [Bryobacteraceae bacterium]
MPVYDAAVIGAGVFGAWTAWHLKRAGARVLLADAWSPGHNRSSSGDESRLIRAGYGAQEIYTRMAMRSLAQWRELFDRTRQPLFHKTGVLWTGCDFDSTVATLARCAVPFETLDAPEIARRFPQFAVKPGTRAIFEIEAGVLMARRAVMAVVADAGVDFVCARHDQVKAGTLIYCCGAWLPKIFPELLGQRIFPTRQEIFYFSTPAGDAQFSPPAMPAWVDFSDPRGPYGVPDIEGRGIKIGFDRHGAAFDPDAGDRAILPESLPEMLQFLPERFPVLSRAKLAETRVCQYENTSSGDFLIDRHPDLRNVWMVGGGSGHGFKHGPAVGEYVAGRVLGDAPEEARFTLATKAERQNRAVY